MLSTDPTAPAPVPASAPAPASAPPPAPAREPASPPRWQAVVLAGGLATRMWPRTERVPKFLLPVAGRPFGERLLERLAASGVTDVVLCIGHLGELIRDVIGDGARFGVRVVYSDEGDRRLGTAGALRHALSRLGPRFLVTYGDSYLPFDYLGPLRDLASHPGALGVMAVYRNADGLDASNAVVSGDLVVRYEKRAPSDPRPPDMDHIDYGATALAREVIADLPEATPLDLSEVQRALASSGRLRAHVASERFYEIGSERGLRDLESHLRALESRLAAPSSSSAAPSPPAALSAAAPSAAAPSLPAAPSAAAPSAGASSLPAADSPSPAPAASPVRR